jgi:hypothetical protein
MTAGTTTFPPGAGPAANDPWEAARQQWRAQTGREIERVQAELAGAAPGRIARETIYAPMHDIAGLGGALGYPLIGQIARALTEKLRGLPDPLDAAGLALARAHVSALAALHVRDVRGEGGPAGAAVLERLAAIG